jgi:beta-glucuronidase
MEGVVMKKTAALLYPRASAYRQIVSMDGMWKFRMDSENRGGIEDWKDGIGKADSIPVPAAFQDFYTDKDSREFAGNFWYETTVVVPAEWRGRDVAVRFDGVAHRATVYLNGLEITSHEGGFLPFAADITDVAVYGGENRLVVKGNNELSETSLPCGRTETLPNGKRMVKPYFDFFNYAGILRPVRLLSLPKTAITDVSVVTRIDGEIDYSVKTNHADNNGGIAVSLSLLDENGHEAAAGTGTKGTLKLANPRLWKVRDAYLYRLWVHLHQGGVLVDEWHEDIGIRVVEIRGKDILINGESVYLKGFGRHEDGDVIGRGFSPAQMKRDMELLKWSGANSFRTSHYPWCEEMYQLADREGFLVIDEAPAVGLYDSTANALDAAMGKKKVPFFDKETVPALLENHLSDVEAMIARDKNHPCVIAWSLANEPESTCEKASPYFQKIFDAARKADPQKRPRTFTLIMFSRPENCKCFQFCDFISLNRYYGWYILGGYEIETAETALRSELEGWKAKDLRKPFVFTEYGADADNALNKLPSVMWSQDYQIEILRMTHRIFDAYEFVKGEQVWAFADFQTGEAIHRLDGNKKGIFTRQRQPKAAAYYLKQRWESLPLNYKKDTKLIEN